MFARKSGSTQVSIIEIALWVVAIIIMLIAVGALFKYLLFDKLF